MQGIEKGILVTGELSIRTNAGAATRTAADTLGLTVFFSAPAITFGYRRLLRRAY
jgi:hypothetical protein